MSRKQENGISWVRRKWWITDSDYWFCLYTWWYRPSGTFQITRRKREVLSWFFCSRENCFLQRMKRLGQPWSTISRLRLDRLDQMGQDSSKFRFSFRHELCSLLYLRTNCKTVTRSSFLRVLIRFMSMTCRWFVNTATLTKLRTKIVSYFTVIAIKLLDNK